jgi:alkanesulfonate monooxygenase SsuD/methylene tetrahydromethanopterin reductase-like flavin-dependent oxidoreductase (luciferase family)
MGQNLMRFNLARSTDATGPDRARLTTTMLDLAGLADAAGMDELSFSEHHVTANDSITSPLLVTSMALARTSRIRISVSALLLPLHDPIEVAEELATLEESFPGRVRVTVVLGYRPEEYERYGRDFARRGVLMDAALESLLAAWPPARDLVAVGGESRLAAERAARHGVAFAPRAHLPALEEIYRAECLARGVEAALWMPTPSFVQLHVSRDPEASWRIAGPHYVDDAAVYSGWQRGGVASPVLSDARTTEELRAGSVVSMLTPAEAVELATGDDALTICLHPLAGGMPDDEARASVGLFCDEVLPHLTPVDTDEGTSRP